MKDLSILGLPHTFCPMEDRYHKLDDLASRAWRRILNVDDGAAIQMAKEGALGYYGSQT